jgi:hypothetical protein
VAALDEADAVLGEFPEWVDHRVHGVHGGGAGRRRSRGPLAFCLESGWRRRRSRGGGVWLCAS